VNVLQGVAVEDDEVCRGMSSKAIPSVRRVACPPDMGTVYRSPSKSNVTISPSGETSKEIQVPSSVVKRRVRTG
jgi:hypothetical protein